jgi:hypothetical protein
VKASWELLFRKDVDAGAMVIIALLVALAASASAEVPPDQIAALKELFISTDGPAWRNSTMWNVGNPCDANTTHSSPWYGLACSFFGKLYVVGVAVSGSEIPAAKRPRVTW